MFLQKPHSSIFIFIKNLFVKNSYCLAMVFSDQVFPERTFPENVLSKSGHCNANLITYNLPGLSSRPKVSFGNLGLTESIFFENNVFRKMFLRKPHFSIIVQKLILEKLILKFL